jgi:hypothetical protein
MRNAGSAWKSRAAGILILLFAPFLTAYYSSCTKSTVGFYPNYPWVSATSNPTLWSAAQSKATDTPIKGTVLFVPWNNTDPVNGWYDTSYSTCTLNTTKLSNYLTNFLTPWINKNNLDLNLDLVFIVHSGNGTTLGPPCVQYHDMATARAEFQNFYDAVFNVLSNSNYNDSTGVQLLVTIGNEIDLVYGTDVNGWNNFATQFFAQSRAYVVSKVLPSGYQPLVGASVRWFGIYSYYGGFIYNMEPQATALFEMSDIIPLTYYPVDVGFYALNPTRAAADFGQMAMKAQTVSSKVGYVVPVYVQEVRSSSKRVPPEFGRLISLGAKKSCAAIS